MYDKIEFTTNKAGTATFQFNLDPDPNGWVAVERLYYEVDARGTDRPRPEAMGSYPSFKYYGNLLIHLDGHMMAGDAALFNVYKQAMINTIMPLPTVDQTLRVHGTFRIKFAGVAQDYTIDVQVESFPDIPSEALSPSRASASWTFRGFTPYMFKPDASPVWVA